MPKKVARKALDLALARELGSLILEVKVRAAKMENCAELWDLESWLTERRREIDKKYDYRYSVLLLVFAQLVRSGYLVENELHGLGREKLKLIRRAAAI